MKVALLADGGYLVLALPLLVVLVAGCVFIGIALRDGTSKDRSSVRVLPTKHLSRLLHAALRPQRAMPPDEAAARRSQPVAAPGPRARGRKHLRVVRTRSPK